MKKIILTIIIGFTLAANCYSQDADRVSPHEIYVGGGVLNDNQLLSMVGDFAATVVTLGQAVQADKYKILTPFVGYRYWFNERVGVGALFAFDSNSVKALHSRGGGSLADGEWRVHNRYFYTVAADLNWNYIYRPTFQLYGNVGLGGTLVRFSDNKTEHPDEQLKQFPYFNMHLSPLGIRFGGQIGGFAEIGWGYKGFFTVGISAKL